MSDDRPPYTANLIAKLADALAEVEGAGTVHPGDLARALLARDLWLVDRARRSHLVDDLVYESALHRGRIGRRYLAPRNPAPAVWQRLNLDALIEGPRQWHETSTPNERAAMWAAERKSWMRQEKD